MEELGIDALIIGPSPDLVYLSGFGGRQSERLLLFILPRLGTPRLLLPSFEAPRIAALLPDVEMTLWDDGEDPLRDLRALVSRRTSARIGVGAQLFASTILALSDRLDEAQFVDASTVLAELRLRKSEADLELLRHTATAADATLSDLFAEELAGRAESTLAMLAAQHLLEHGVDDVGHTLVATGANTVVPHHHPSRDRVEVGATLFDIGGVYGGYRSDVTRTICVGPPDDELRRVHACVLNASEKAFSRV